MSKIDDYQALIAEVKKKYSTNNPDDPLIWCTDCKEINLWTYWQGRGNVDTCKIMLVGQDWGSIGEDCCDIGLDNVKRMDKDEQVGYMDNNSDITNQHLTELFVELGYPDITKASARNRELFFTNLCLGYRKEKTSRKLKSSLLYGDIQLFRKLVEIIKPEAIICLGKQTWTGVLKSFDERPIPIITSFNKALDERKNISIRHYADGTQVKVFAVSHPGAMGTLNRNRVLNPDWHKGCDPAIKKFLTNDCLQKQKEDWRNIKAML